MDLLFFLSFILSIRSHSNQFIVATAFFSYFSSSMARTKLMPKKDRQEKEGRWVLRPKAERERIAREARKEKT